MAPARSRSNRPHPAVPLSTALQVPEAIADSNASRPMNRLLLADAMKYSPSSSGFRDRIAASAKYGLTEGNYNSETIALTPLGASVTRPRNEAERVEAKRKALLSVPLFGALIDHFSNARLPETDFLKNVLEREPFGIDSSWSADAAAAFSEDAREVGYLRTIGGSPHIVLDASGAIPKDVTQPNLPEDIPEAATQQQDGLDVTEGSSGSALLHDIERQKPEGAGRPLAMQIFIAHGSSRKPLDQLKEILNSWKVPFLVAVDEANAGRPISEKVADTMRQCSAGIFIFTADEQFRNENGETISRPSQNVVYELGAASLLYGRKIVILKESGVTFPSDFSDLGWIEFDKDALEAKAMDLLREMIALDAVRLVSAGSE